VTTAGTYTARVRHVDESGNLSANTVSATAGVAANDVAPALIGPVGTGDIAAQAATEVYVTTPGSAVTVTQLSFVPDNYGRNTVVATVSFTPSHSGSAQLFFDGRGTYTDGVGVGAQARWSLQQDGATWDNGKRISFYLAPGSVTTPFPIQTSRRFAVTGGVSYSFSLYACKFEGSDTFVIDQMELRAEVIKR
jgi:hypothetical protein